LLVVSMSACSTPVTTPTLTPAPNPTVTATTAPTTSASNPDVKIESLTLPTNAKVSLGTPPTTYTTTFRLVNKESVDVTVDWQLNSSVSGTLPGGSVTVPKSSYVDVTKPYYYTVAGAVTFTYTIYYNGVRLDTKSGTINIAPSDTPNVKIESLTLPTNAKVSSSSAQINYNNVLRLMNKESVDVTVNWELNSSVTGTLPGGSVTVPKSSYVDVTKPYYYTVAGAVTFTYTIYYNGVQLDTKSGTMTVAP
jgi:hypothetical protein